MEERVPTFADGREVALNVSVVEHCAEEGQLDIAVAIARLPGMSEGEWLARVEANTVLGALRGAATAAFDAMNLVYWRDLIAAGAEAMRDATAD